MDAGNGSYVLREPPIAELVQGSLLCFDGERYGLLAWVVMPNHVHVLFQPISGWTVGKIAASWKKVTARGICDWRRANGEELVSPGLLKRQSGDWRSRGKERGQSGDWRSQGKERDQSGDLCSRTVWHREYWDRYIRDRGHFEQVVEYIHLNPVKAGLGEAARSWRWSSAYYRNLGMAEHANLEIDVPGRKARPGSL